MVQDSPNSTFRKTKPYRKICLSLPIALLDRLGEYPGEQSAKIQILCEYALEMGCLMTNAEAKKLAGAKLFEAIKTNRKIPAIFEGL